MGKKVQQPAGKTKRAHLWLWCEFLQVTKSVIGFQRESTVQAFQAREMTDNILSLMDRLTKNARVSESQAVALEGVFRKGSADHVRRKIAAMPPDATNKAIIDGVASIRYHRGRK